LKKLTLLVKLEDTYSRSLWRDPGFEVVTRVKVVTGPAQKINRIERNQNIHLRKILYFK